jgi:hypothetical protein
LEELAQEIPPAHEDLPLESTVVETESAEADAGIPGEPDAAVQHETAEEPEPLAKLWQENSPADKDLPFEPATDEAELAEEVARIPVESESEPLEEVANESPSADRDLPFQPAPEKAEFGEEMAPIPVEPESEPLEEVGQESARADTDLPWQPADAAESAPRSGEPEAALQLESLDDETKELPAGLPAVDAVELADQEEQPEPVGHTNEPVDEYAGYPEEDEAPAVQGLQTAADTLQAYAEEAAEEPELQAAEAEHLAQCAEPGPEQVEDPEVNEDTDPMPLTAEQARKMREATEPEQAEAMRQPSLCPSREAEEAPPAAAATRARGVGARPSATDARGGQLEA